MPHNGHVHDLAAPVVDAPAVNRHPEAPAVRAPHEVPAVVAVPTDPASPLERRAAWRAPLAALAITIAWVFAWYWDTAASIVDVWMRSATFTHGFVVVPVAVWLAWQRREELARSVPRPMHWPLLPIGAAGAAWLLGQLAAANSVMHLALVSMLVLAVPVVLGPAVASVLLFPLGFLFFAVPIGDFMIPQLMTWTADFTVSALRASGIPVYREGLYFVIPSGTWSVVEACSGVRYLMASLMVGTLFAYLTYRSMQRRLIFVGCAILVPIVANWLRAYIIVMLGHLTDNRLAAGVDHLIYGWVFFGIVIGLMFWIGNRWREDTSPAPVTAPAPSPPNAAPRRFWPAALAVAIVTAIWPATYARIEAGALVAKAVLAPIAYAADWSPVPGQLAPWRPDYREAPAEAHVQVAGAGGRVGLYIAYYRNQDAKHELVSSENVLVRADDPAWNQIATGARRASAAHGEVDVVTAELVHRGSDQRVLAWRWFWVDGRITASDHLAKLYTVLARLQGRGDDSAAVVVYARGDPSAASALLERFVRDNADAIGAALRQTRDAR